MGQVENAIIKSGLRLDKRKTIDEWIGELYYDAKYGILTPRKWSNKFKKIIKNQ